MVTFLEQSVQFEQGQKVWGTYVVQSDEEAYQEELQRKNVRIGSVSFSYEVAENKLSFDVKNCEEYIGAHYQQLVETVWSKIKLVMNYWNSDEYADRVRLEEKIGKGK